MALIDDIKKHEGFSSVVYKCTAGYDTIGYGKRIKYLQVTEEQATEWLEEDLENLKYTLSGKYDWFLPAPQEVRDIEMNMNQICICNYMILLIDSLQCINFLPVFLYQQVR